MNKFYNKTQLENIAIVLTVAIFFIADRYLKFLALNFSADEPTRLVDHLLSFHPTANYFLAFSLPIAGPSIIAAVGLIIIIVAIHIFHLMRQKNNLRSEIVLWTMIFLGALSNIFDRLTYGYVIDYLDLRYFTVFNLADLMISGGALLLIIKTIRKK